MGHAIAWHIECKSSGVQIPQASTAVSPKFPRAQTIAACLLIAAAALVAYNNSFKVPFVFDDISGILDNPSIRGLWPVWDALHPPAGTTLTGRPVANLTFAINYAVGGPEPWGFHATNLIIHIMSGLALFGVTRRTFMRPRMSEGFGRDATPLALLIALLWVLHPLQTEAVTYSVQRVESLMGLFYLLTLYCFVRSIGSDRALGWQACAFLACAIGMGTKEVMATAPVMVFLYDRTFAAGTFGRAWKLRWRFYAILATTWLPLALLARDAASRHGSAGFGTAVRAPDYWLAQFEAITRYLRLSIWPSSLVFDYGIVLPGGGPGLFLSASFVILLVGITAVGLWRMPAMGFLGTWFFVILMPTTAVPIATQTLAEHRMYLPVAAPMALIGVLFYKAAGRRFVALLALPVLALCFLTFGRNATYRNAVTLWGDTVSKMPGNARAHCSLGISLSTIPGELPLAIAEYEEALRIHPDYADAHNNLGIALENLPGQLDAAIGHFQEAVRLRPAFAEAHNNLGVALARSNRIPESALEYETALHLRPDYAQARANLGSLLVGAGRIQEAIPELDAALAFDSHNASAQYYLGNALAQSGRFAEAILHYGEALRAHPDFPEASNNLGMVLFRTGRPQEGIRHIKAAIEMEPGFVPAHFALAAALLQTGRRTDAFAEYERVLQLRPGDPTALRMVELLSSGQ